MSFIGKSGSFTMSGTDYSAAGSLCIQDWSVDITAAIDTFYCMGAAGNWTQSLGGPKSWSGTVNASLDETNGLDLANTVGESAACVFETTDGLAFSGTAIIASANATVPGETRATCSFSVTGSGALGEA